MATTYEVIFLGTLPRIDTTQGNEVAENAAGILGTYGTSAAPLSGQVRTLSANDTTEDENETYDTDNTGGYDSFRINGGAAQNFDAVAVYNAVITYADGTTATITATVFQDVNGNTYLAPEATNDSDQVALTAKPIMSLSLNSVSNATGDMGADRVAGDFISSVDGTTGADTMNVGYTDAQGDRVTDGNDYIVSGAGNDSVNAGGGNDTVSAGSGNDTVLGGAGADSIDGGDGNDVIGTWMGDDGNDTMRGGAGNDSIIGGTGDDVVHGDDGDDSLFGGGGNDTLFGGAGNDMAGITDDHNGDVYDLGEGTGDQDAVWFANFASSNGVNVTFTGNDAATYAFAGGFASGSFSGVEIVGGTENNDTINAGADTDGQTLFGQGGADRITGGSGNNIIYGGTGADSIDSGAGADWVYGDDGNDVLFFGTGNDNIFGGAGDDLIDDVGGSQSGAFNDSVDGGDGNDTIYTGGGNDTLLGGAGNDILHGEDGNDSIDGGSGNDSLLGGNGNDTLIGGAGADTVSGEAGDDVINLTANDQAADMAFGGDGNDLITSRTDLEGGNDSLYGGAGRDTLVAGAGDFVDGGSSGDDFDTLDLNSAPVAGTTTIAFSGTGAGSVSNSGQTLTFTEIEAIRATEGADSINATADTGGMTIIAGAGNDSVFGGSGRDSFSGGLGNDSLQGGAGNDTLDGGAGDDSLFGGAGADLLFGGAGSDSLSGGDDSDTIYAGAGDIVIGGEGGTDSDSMVLNWADVQSISYGSNGESGTVTFTNASGGGNLTFSEMEAIRYTGAIDGTAGNDVITAGMADAEGDQIDGADGNNDTVNAGAGNDSVAAGAGNDLVFGGTGNDSLSGADGADTLDGGEGDDTLIGGAGADSLLGGAGNDVFLVTGDDGADVLNGGPGTDTLDLSGSATAAHVDLGSNGQGFLRFSGSPDDQVSGLDAVVGSAFNDTIMGTGGNQETLSGGDGNDFIRARGGDDASFGGAGDDTLNGNEGNNTLSGGTGNDTFLLDETSIIATNQIIGGENAGDFDLLDYSARTDSITINFTGTGSGTGSSATFTEMEGVRTGSGDDVIVASADTQGVSVDTGAGADRATGGSGNDTLTGGAGSDTLDGGAGNDRLSGGAGNDALFGGGGNDTAVFSGNVTDYTFDRGPNGELMVTSGPGISDGTDALSGVEFASFNGMTYRVMTGDEADNQTLQGPADGIPVLVVAYGGADWGGGHATNDVMFGGDGSDTLDGGDGDDRLSGGAGNDLLRGDSGNDTLTGGTGADTLRGGAGDDLLAGGEGADIVEMSGAGGSDRVADFDMTVVDGRTVDQLDVSELVNGDGDPVTWQDVTISDTIGDGSGDAVLTFPGGERVVLEGVSVQQANGKANLYAMGIPCFAAGTPILTPDGWCRVETLATRHLVLTEAGPSRIIWAGAQHLGASNLMRNPDHRPVHFPAGSIGNSRAIRLSPQHAVRMRDAGGRKVLVRARHLAEIGFGGARICRGVREVTYHHLLLERHAVICAAGAPAESFYPGAQALRMMDRSARIAIAAAIAAQVCGHLVVEGELAERYGARVHPLLTRAQLGRLSVASFEALRTNQRRQPHYVQAGEEAKVGQ